MIDYILIRRNNISQVNDCKSIPGESIATQHIIITMDICIKTQKRVKSRRRKQQIKWWRMKDRDENRKFASQIEENIEVIKEWNQQENKNIYDKLDSIEGQTIIYKLSKTRDRRTRELTDIAYIKDRNGTILMDEEEIKARWKESFETPLNVENDREELEPTYPVQGPIPSVKCH